jgi:hypothetical protein
MVASIPRGDVVVPHAGNAGQVAGGVDRSDMFYPLMLCKNLKKTNNLKDY